VERAQIKTFCLQVSSAESEIFLIFFSDAEPWNEITEIEV